MNIFKPLAISLSPNAQADDVWLALGLLFKPKLWVAGGAGKKLEHLFKKYLNARYAVSFNSGRSALLAILKSLAIQEGDEVLLQAFTCNAVPNPVIWAGARPIYVDIDESLNVDPVSLEKTIASRKAHGKRPKAVIVQHTLGVPAQIGKIRAVAKKHHLILIEDCAHALGAEYKGQKAGTFGDIAFFSFGRDKVISSVWGGMITTNNPEVAQKLTALQESYPMPSRKWVARQLLHPILFSLIIPTYYIFGKYLLIFLKAVRGVGLAVSKKERTGEKPDMFPARMPNALAILALHQFNKLEKYNAHRRKIAKLYTDELKAGTVLALPAHNEGAIYLRFNILHPRAKEILKSAKRKRMLLGNWYGNIVDPGGTDFKKLHYAPSSCPNAEKAARESINLPTHINISADDAQRVIQHLRNFR